MIDRSVDCSAGDWIGWLVDFITGTITNIENMLRDLGVHNAKEPAHTDYETKHTVKKTVYTDGFIQYKLRLPSRYRQNWTIYIPFESP